MQEFVKKQLIGYLKFKIMALEKYFYLLLMLMEPVGLDINLLDLTIKKINVPLIIHGGAGSIDDIANIIRDYDIDGVSSSLFHYSSLKLLTYENKDIAVGNTNFVDNYQNFNKFNIINLYDLKTIIKKIKDKLNY